jgi:CubicO group peptidase (beta-lactamase class C family)
MARIEQLDLVASVREILNRRPAVGLAVGVVRNGELESFSAHGLADIERRRRVTEDTVFRVASITKTFTAVAVMQLAERGQIELDAPAADHLRAYALVPRSRGWRPATVRDLLTHTAGVPEQLPRSGILRRDFGESVPAGGPVPTLAQFYCGRLPLDAEPGTRFRYGNHGPATLGQIVEDVTGQPLAPYLAEHVFGPLGMADTTLDPAQVNRSRAATGYTLGRRGTRAVVDRETVTAGAAAAWSTARDMARYVAALLGGGTNAHGTVLEPATLTSMFEVQYQPDPRIPGMGLGLWRRSLGSHRAVEHQGVMPGFDSQIFAAPDDGVGVLAFTNGTRQGGFWLPTETERLLARLIGVPPATVRADVPEHPEVWGDLCGWYYLPGPPSDVRVRTAFGAGIEVFVRRGRLHARCLTPVPQLARGAALHADDPEDPYVFRLDLMEPGLVPTRLVFSQRPGAGTTAVHLDFMPLSADKQSTATNPRRWATGAVLAAGAAAIARGRSHAGSGPEPVPPAHGGRR